CGPGRAGFYRANRQVTPMANSRLIEQLDEAVEAILANASLPAVNASVDPLLRVAAELRNLPSQDFKARLKGDLERKISMTRTAVKPVRKGFHTITPYLIVKEAAELIDFVKQAFGADELFRTTGTGTAGGIHAEVKIGDSIVMMGGGPALQHASTPTGIHLYVEDADAVYERALTA